MEEYVVIITETLVREVSITAPCATDAMSEVIKQYDREDIVLDYSDFEDVKFSMKKSKKGIDIIK